jgi:hypothetical protein
MGEVPIQTKRTVCEQIVRVHTIESLITITA